MADIKRLLNKKGWTGRELGIIEITDMATAFANDLAGKPSKPLVEDNEFMRMLGSLTDKHQAKIYSGYIAIHKWLTIAYNIAQTNLMQAQMQFKSISSYITAAEIAETAYRYVEQLPAIMTQKQYDETLKQGRKKYLNGEDGEGIAYSVLNLIYYAMEYYIKLLVKNPNKPNPLKPIRKKYLTAPVKSQLIRSRYSKAAGSGYYTLEDGRRSDQMSKEEWREAIQTPKLKNALEKEAKESFKELKKSGVFIGEESCFNDTIQKTVDIIEERIIKKAEVIFNGGTNKEAEESLEKLTFPCEWHYYEDAPEDLNKWEILEDSSTCYEIFKKSLGGEATTSEEYIEEAKVFVEEFKEAVDIIIEDIDSRHFKGVNGLANLPIEKWEETIFDWEQLYEKNFYGFKEDTDQDFNIFQENYRARTNGIAIIRPSDTLDKSRYIDDNGYFIEPEIESTFDRFSLESFFPEAEEYAERIEEIEKGREALLDSYYFLKGYNLTIDLTAEYYDIPAISVFKVNLEGIEVKIDIMNKITPIVYMQVNSTYYEDEELKKKKLQVLKDIFPTIDYKSVTIPEENIEALKKSFKDFKAFTNIETILKLVCYRPHEDKGSGE